MVIKTYFDKNNTIVNNLNVNTGLNPVSELFYGGPLGEQSYSRLLFYFDETRLKSLYTGGTFTDLTKLKHTLKLTNTASFDTDLLNGNMGGKERASSFDLILFKITQDWDNGVGYDYTICDDLITGDCAYSNGPSNWIEAQTGIFWSGGSGVYSGSPSGITVTTQHFDKGNEDIEMDITDFVNGLLTGDTNYGLGISYDRNFEQLYTTRLQYVGFFTNNTQTFYEPYVETIYNNHIKDDRHNFYLDKPNKLYLYVNLAGNPTNLDANPTCIVYDNDNNILSSYTQNNVTHVTLGVYSIDVLVNTTNSNIETMYNDVWSNIVINNVTRPDASLNFVTKSSLDYYNIGDNSTLPKKVGVNVSGIQNKEKIKRGDIRKVIVTARIPYTVEQTQTVKELKYRIYVKEGNSELTTIDFQTVELANNYYYFLLDTNSLLPSTYYLDILAYSDLEVTTLKQVLQFEIVNQVELKKS
jgi:hypothetical protein